MCGCSKSGNRRRTGCGHLPFIRNWQSLFVSRVVCIDLFELTAVLWSISTTPPLMSNGFLLLVQECAEHGLLDVHFVRASVWIDEGIPGTLSELRVLFLQVVLGCVVAEQHVACERTH